MINHTDAILTDLAVHKIGLKANEEGVRTSKAALRINDEINDLLRAYFLSPFKSNEYYNLFHESDLLLNEVYAYVSRIFDAPDEELFEQSVNLAKHLYEQSTHPNIKPGEFYVAYFTDCVVEGETVDAVGLFKSENKDTFLKVFPAGEGFAIESQQGVNINKLDKGCLIFNTARENGYTVAVVDNTNRSTEARYWIDDFLHLRQRNDDYQRTRQMMALCKNFVSTRLPEEFEVSRADQADLLNKSVKFFKEKDNFDLQEFTQEVMDGQPEVANSFKSFKSAFEQEWDTPLPDQFNLSVEAVKKQARVLKSVIKLDKNFHVYVHGNRQYIQRGYDEEKKMHFYQLFFQNED